MSDHKDPTTIDERLDELIGPIDETCKGVYRRVHKMMCPCLDDKACLWPHCAKIGNGIGHYP